MPLLKKTQRSFAGGMIDKDLTGRQDIKKYSEGCLVLENFKVRKQGNVIKRSGTDLVCDFSGCLAEGSVEDAKLVPLVQERASGLYILFTAKKAFLVSPSGMKMSDGSWSQTPDGSAYSIDVPFEDSDLKMLDWCQSGDTVFFAHRSYPPGKIVYRSGEIEYERLNFRQASGKQPIIKSVVGSGGFGDGSTKEVEYCVTAVKDGVESAPSPAYAVSYQMPWGDKASFKITIDSASIDPDDFDTFYIYKKESDVFGLIGTTSNKVAFVDISDGFNVGGNLYPSGFTQFDKKVHLRDSASNRFASVSAVTDVTVTNTTSTVVGLGQLSSLAEFPVEAVFVGETSAGNTAKNNWAATKRYETTDRKTNAVSYSSSAHKTANTLTFSFSPIIMSSFKVSIGTILHSVEKTTTNDIHQTWYHCRSGRQGKNYYVAAYPLETRTSSTKYVGAYTEFHASPAVHYTARVDFSDGSSVNIAATANVNQRNFDKSGWSAVAGTTNCWRRNYAPDEYMLSYDGASYVLARMDTYKPNVGSTVGFMLPDSAKGKSCVSVKIYGYTDDSKSVAAPIIVNGLACYSDGKFVYTFTDDYITPDLTITPPKTTDHFINPSEYPGCVQLYSQRLVYGSSTDNPFTFWMSATGDLYNFDTHEYIRASDAITASTAAVEMPRINRMLVHRDLMLFAEGGEWQVSTTSGNTVSPTTIAAKLQSAIGCAAWLKPIPIDTDILFCDSSGEALLATRYNFATDGYESSNLSVLSQRLFRNNPIMAMAFAQFPESTVECVLADGTIASLVYMKEHDVCAWSLHRLGGGWKAKDVAANKAIDAGSSNCAFLARRKNGDAVQWAVLAIRDIDPNDSTLKGNLRMDAVRISGTEPTAGEGETIVRIGDAKWAVGSTFESVIKTTSPEFSEQETAQMEIKNATEVEVRVIDGSTFTARQSDVSEKMATTLAVPCEVSAEGSDYTVAPGDADCRLPITGTNTRNGSIVIRHNGYLPLAILSVSTAYRIEFANHANGGSDNGRG